MDSTFRFLIKPRANVAGFLLTTAAIVLFFSQLQSGYAQDEQGASVPAAGEQTPNGPVDGNGIEPVPSPAAKASAGANRPQTVSVKAFGAVGDGVTNDTTAFNKALAACAVNGGTCLVPEGTYVISASGISPERNKACVVSGVHLKGAGQASILKVAGMPTNHLLQCNGDNWSVENLTFDMQDYTASKIGYAAITCRGNNWRVAHCAIVRSGRWAIQAYGGSNWTIEANYINRTVPGATPPTGAVLVTAQNGVWSNHGRVIDNVCEGVGISFSGTDGLIARNRVNRSGSGSGIFVQGFPSTRSPKIIGNICSGGSSGYDAAVGGRWASVTGFEIWAPESVICNNIAHDNDAGGIAVGGQNSIVIGNTAYNNGRAHPGFGGFVARVNPNRGASASHSVFIGNVAYDSRYPSHNATQDFGFIEQNAARDFRTMSPATEITDIKHLGNDYNRNRVGSIKSRARRQPLTDTQISPEMKSRLSALARDTDLPEKTRNAVRASLAR